jgi:hypothetical protein
MPRPWPLEKEEGALEDGAGPQLFISSSSSSSTWKIDIIAHKTSLHHKEMNHVSGELSPEPGARKSPPGLDRTSSKPWRNG